MNPGAAAIMERGEYRRRRHEVVSCRRNSDHTENRRMDYGALTA
jgi:hypothetical protein